MKTQHLKVRGRWQRRGSCIIRSNILVPMLLWILLTAALLGFSFACRHVLTCRM